MLTIICYHDGCSTTDLKENMEKDKHQDYCVHRAHDSPARDSYKMCDWIGPVAKVGEHMAQHNCATLLLPEKPHEEGNTIKFSKIIKNQGNIFFEDYDRNFKPLVLLHPKLVRGLFWIQMERIEEHFWIVYALANLTEKALAKTRAEIRITSVTNKTFNGNVRVISAV